MNRYLATVCFVLGFCRFALAGSPAPAITPEYINYGVTGVLSPTPVVDATAFLNQGEFYVETVTSLSVTNKNNVFDNGYSFFPFETKDTLYFTNTVSGMMLGLPGFQFDTGTSTSRHSASFVLNLGVIEGFDDPADIFLYSVPGGTTFVPAPAENQPIASVITVLATNIVNSGSMAVGNAGTLTLTGNNVTNAFGTLSAGSVNTAGLLTDPLDTTGLSGQIPFTAADGTYYYDPSPEVYDLFWGITNGLSLGVDGLAGDLETLSEGAAGLVIGEVPSIPTTSRSPFTLPTPGFYPLNFDTAQWSVTATLNIVNGTNIYYNVVFVNTNFANTNMSATVGVFEGGDDAEDILTPTTDDENAFEDIVQIAEPVVDVLTGQTVTNGIYLIDDGAILPSMVLAQNASLPAGYFRPNAIELTTETPPEWEFSVLDAEELAFPFLSEAIYTPNVFNAANNKAPFEISEYGAQIGRNPSDVLGSFGSLAETNSEAFDLLNDFFIVNLLDPTNDPARIQINANNLDLNQARMRAEGMVILNVTNLLNGGTAAVDWGEANVAIGVSNGLLNISNIFPRDFQRVRGDIYAWSATWQNTQTNANFFLGTTNNWHYHVLIVDQNLYGSFTPTVRNLALTGGKSIVLQDNLNVNSQVVINTTNLTIESSNYFSQYAQDFTPAATPFMKNLFITPTGFLGSANILDIGYSQNVGPTAPAGRSYKVNTLTNFGELSSVAPLLQAATIENDGIIATTDGGSMLIEASNLSMGLALTGATNYLEADGSINLSAQDMEISNSVIATGLTTPAALMLTATAHLTDMVSGTPTTNTNSVIINHWSVTDGFIMDTKPVLGDLFGTEIHTISSGLQYVTHVWAATDWSNNVARGFSQNEVIGRLVLDRQSATSTLHFSAAGARNAMYVDYLVLTNYTTNYHSGIAIDPNFTIYFAGCNYDPQKLQEVYPNLIWVTNFVGPNSAYVVPYLPTNSGLYCLINSNVATSADIAFWPARGDNAALLNGTDGFPPWPYLLNNPNDPTDIIPCNSHEINGTYTFDCNCSPGTNMTQLLYSNLTTTSSSTNLTLDLLTVAYNGQGSITPVIQASNLVLGQTYTFTAKPASGWVFDYWTIATLDDATNTNSYSPVLSIDFVTNTVITANFIPSPFPALEGNYNGLFYETNGIDPDTSGSVTLTLLSTGTFSGKLIMGKSIYKFTSQFTGAGAAEFTATSGSQALSVDLQLNITNDTGQILGDVTNADGSVSVLAADLAPVWTAKNPSPLAGIYTMSLPWDTGTDSANETGGDSWGVATVSKLGVMTVAGALADGATYSTSAPISQYGEWPLYISANAGNDTVLGWVTVTNGLSGTNVSWTKEPGNGPLYPGGFATVLQLIGSPWSAPVKNADVLSLTNPLVLFNGGGLANQLVLPASLKGNLTYAATNLSLSIKSSTGSFTGWFEAPGSAKKTTMSGVVLSNQGSARGFFISPNQSQSGSVLLEGQ